MSLDALRESLPDFAKDTKLNVSSLLRGSELTEQQLWGTVIATAASTRNAAVLRSALEDAKTHVGDETVQAALGAATIMAMNNVYYRTRHFLHGSYDDLRAGLRMNIIGSSGGIAKADFELFALAVSAINGCEACVASHEQTLRNEGLSREQIHAALRIAAVVTSLAQAQFITESAGL